MFVKYAVTVAVFTSCIAGSTVEETWKKADHIIEQSAERFAEVHKHADEAASEEQKIADSARQAMHDTADKLKESVDELESARAKLVLPDMKNMPTTITDSSFMELPESFAQFPGVEEDMKKVREAEKVYQEKMNNLRAKDAELMNMAKADFQQGRDVVNMVGNLRSQTKTLGGSSFLQTQGSTPFQKVLDAEASLKAVNDQLAKEFNFE